MPQTALLCAACSATFHRLIICWHRLIICWHGLPIVHRRIICVFPCHGLPIVLRLIICWHQILRLRMACCLLGEILVRNANGSIDAGNVH